MSVKQSVSGFVQAGGKSSRMGQNKALLMLSGIKLIEYSIKNLSQIVSQIGVITNNPEIYSGLNINCYPDTWLGLGPLAGIYSALEHSKYDYVLNLACDMPFVSCELLTLLIEHGQTHQISVPKDQKGQLQPLCALYHKSCQQPILELIKESQYAPRKLFDKVKTQIILFEDFAHLKNSSHFFENINTPEDFELASSYFKD